MSERIPFTPDRMPQVGQAVVDAEGQRGIVRETGDPHNIVVDYPETQGVGIYCLVEDCHEGLYWPLFEAPEDLT
jgi:hypothetical protein